VRSAAFPAISPRWRSESFRARAAASSSALRAASASITAARCGASCGSARVPRFPAVDRYTGVLYDALDAGTLDAAARRWLGGHVMIHSAPFGPVGALDAIPAYRLAAGTTLPGLPPLRRLWADAVTDALAAAAPTFVLDLRSEAYAALGPVPAIKPRAVAMRGREVARARTRSPLACLLKWLSARVVPSAPRVTTRRYAERMPAGTGPSAAYASERRSSTNVGRGPASPPHAA
jgi:hypothetical protein